jgi:hypothetical protein
MKTFKQLTKGFNYINPEIEKNFTLEEPRNSDYKVFKFDKYMSSEEVINEIKKEGYLPATLGELLDYKGEENWLVALGSVGKVHGDRNVLYLHRLDSKRDLKLGWFDDDWNGRYRFLAVRNLELNTSLSLEQAIEVCKKAGLTITKTY